MSSEGLASEPGRPRTLLDVYRDRDFELTDTQVSRLVALLRLTEPKQRPQADKAA